MKQSAESSQGSMRRRLAALIAQQPAGLSGFRLLLSGEDAFTARGELARNAQERLDLQYYIAHDGLSTRLLLEELLQAANRGVQIRLLLDDFASDARDHRILLSAAHPNITMKVFNPPRQGRKRASTRAIGRLREISRQHRRMHNKLMVADGELVIMGGRNLGDEYYDVGNKRNFVDLEVLCVGPVARQFSVAFNEYWEHPLSVPIEQCLRKPGWRLGRSHQPRPLQHAIEEAKSHAPQACDRLTGYRQAPQLDHWLKGLVWASGQAMWDPPGKVMAPGIPAKHQLMTAQLLPTALGVRQELLMISAYFVPTRAGVAYFRECVERGVSVSVLTNALEATDVPLVHGGYQRCRAALLNAGVRLFEMRERPAGDSRYNLARTRMSLHSKVAVFDRRQVFIGPLNFDPRSVLWNTEVGILIDSPELAGAVGGLVSEGCSGAVSYEVRPASGADQLAWHYADDQGDSHCLTQEPGGLWRRLNAWVARTLKLDFYL